MVIRVAEEEQKKEIAELIALYTLEPELRDVYVEGQGDRNLLEWFLQDQRIEGISVYTIDVVNVPSNVLGQYKLDRGSNRARVIALSRELEAQLPLDRKVVCIADRDYEDYLPSGSANPYLEFTDYTSTDMYLFTHRTLQKLVSLVLGGFPFTVDEMMRDLPDLLEEVFLIRLTNDALAWNMKWIPFVKYVGIEAGFHFDAERFVTVYLQKNDRWRERAIFERRRAELRKQLLDDPRHRMRGHDLMELLHYAIKKLRKARCFGNVETVHGVLAGCLEARDIRCEGLFQRVSELV